MGKRWKREGVLVRAPCGRTRPGVRSALKGLVHPVNPQIPDDPFRAIPKGRTPGFAGVAVAV
jgi:hypothetical protein